MLVSVDFCGGGGASLRRKGGSEGPAAVAGVVACIRACGNDKEKKLFAKTQKVGEGCALSLTLSYLQSIQIALE